MIRFDVTPDASPLMMTLTLLPYTTLFRSSVKPEPTSRMPPELTVTPLNTAPSSEERRVGAETRPREAEPVLEKIALPPVEIVTPLSRPADTVAEPPVLSTAPLAVPPDSTRLPELRTVVALAVPLADTISCIPAEMIRFDVTPDASTLMMPLTVLVVKLPAPSSAKPEPTSRMPPELTVTPLNTAP